MNFLVHMLLSGDDEQLMTGNFMGDFVKGPLHDRFPVRILHGVTLHRRIDSFASRNEIFQNSRRRIAPHYGLYRGVMVDLFYDHILVKEWSRWSDRSFECYIGWGRAAISRHHNDLPERLQSLVPYIFDELLPSYAEIQGIGAALARMSRRVTRDNPLAGGEQELLQNYDDFRADFQEFMPQVKAFAAEFDFSHPS